MKAKGQTMRDSSMFQGIKELRELRFEDTGGTWRVRKSRGDAWFDGWGIIGHIWKLPRESNRRLYERGLELLEKPEEARD